MKTLLTDTNHLIRGQLLYIGTAFILLFLLLFFGEIQANAATEEFPLEVTQQQTVPDGYTAIRTAEDLAGIKNDKSGKYILMNDIDLSSMDSWSSISSFSGQLNGNGYKIIGLKDALFVSIQGGTVTNLALVDVNVNRTGKAGALACEIYNKSSSSITIYNIYVTGLVTGENNVGGLIGIDRSITSRSTSISYCSNYAYVLSEYSSIGGIIGESTSSVKLILSNLKNYGIVRGKGNYIGGIAGYLMQENSYTRNMSNCSNEGTVIGKQYVGGIAGALYCKTSTADSYMYISGMQNSGTIQGTSHVGGIIGSVEINDAVTNKNAKITISSCTNLGKIDSSSSTSGGIIGSAYHTFAGTTSGAITIQNCINRGDMKNGGNIVGSAYLATGSMYIKKCVGIQLSGSGVAGIICNVSGNNGMYSGYCYIYDSYYLNTYSKYAFPSSGKASGTATALDSTTVKQQDSYTALDFSYLWGIDANVQDGYPYLKAAENLESQEKTEAKDTTETNVVAQMKQRTGDTGVPYSEFNLPLTLCQDYDDSLGFKVNATAYITGKAFTTSQLWVNTYENVLEDIFLEDSDFLEGIEDATSLYGDEISFAEDFLDLFAENICEDIPAFKVAGGVNDIIRLINAQDQDVVTRCVVDMEYLTYIAENTTDKNLKKAAETIRDRKCSKTIEYLSGHIVDFGKSMGIKVAEKVAIAAAQKSWTAVATTVSSALGAVKVVTFLVEVKNLAYELSGASKPVEAYFNIYAESEIRQMLYGYYGNIVQTTKYTEIGDCFNVIENLTKTMYSDAKTLLGSKYDQVLASDKYFSQQVKDLSKLNIKNYTKKSYKLLTPSLDSNVIAVAQGTSQSIVVNGCRSGLKITYKETTKSDAFSVNGKGVIKASKKKTGSGQITVTIKQNNKEYSMLLNVYVVSAYTLKNSVTTKSSYTKVSGSDAFVLPIITQSTGAVTFKSNNKSVAVVNKKGKVTLKGYGTATITITVAKTKKFAKKTQKVTIKVVPKTPKKPTVKKSGKKALKVTWKKNKKITGYEIRYSTKSNMKKAKVVKVSAKKTSVVLKKLTSGKKYYVQIRSYKKTGKKKMYSSWSKKVSAKVK